MIIPDRLRRVWASLLGRHYFEDYIRVYPDNNVYDKHGKPVNYTDQHHRNFLNHKKFYHFASQYILLNKSVVLDAGCGSGYGAKILKEKGAMRVDAFDISSHAIDFAVRNYSNFANFKVCGITESTKFAPETFDLITCSEVLEHIKEYSKEKDALAGLKKLMKPNAVLVIGTPNDEMLPNHGFSYDEIDSLIKSFFFKNYVIIENALLPPAERLHLWEKRKAIGKTGLSFELDINFDETVCDEKIASTKCKKGLDCDIYNSWLIDIKTKYLHNTHSWIVVALKD